MIGCSLRVAAGVTRCVEVTAMQERTEERCGPLAAEDWCCNPALLCLCCESPDSSPGLVCRLRLLIDHLRLITGCVLTHRRAEESAGINAAAHAPHRTPQSANKCCSQNILGGTRSAIVVKKSRALASSTSAERRPFAASAVGIDVARGARDTR